MVPFVLCPANGAFSFSSSHEWGFDSIIIGDARGWSRVRTAAACVWMLLAMSSAVHAYEVELVTPPGELPVFYGNDYQDPFPNGERVTFLVTIACDEIALTDALAGEEIHLQLRREVDWRLGFGFAGGMPEGRFAMDASPCATNPEEDLTRNVNGYMAASTLLEAFQPYNVTIGVYPDYQGTGGGPQETMEPPDTIQFQASVEYTGGVWPTLAGVHESEGAMTLDILLQTTANADTVFGFTIINGTDALDLPVTRLNVTEGDDTRLVTARFPIPDNATVDSVYNWTLDVWGHAVMDPQQMVDNRTLQFEVQPYADGIPIRGATGFGMDGQTMDGVGENVKAIPAPLGSLALLGVAFWSRR